jgi:hypothetical protein
VDFNLVRLRIPLTTAAEQRLAVALAGPGGTFEEPLAVLCSRSLSSDPELVRRHQKPGLPFVFSLPAGGATDCLLIGPAIAELSRILSTLAAIAGTPPLNSFCAFDYQGREIPLTADGGDELPVLSAAELLDMASPRYGGCTRLRIKLQTPLRLVANGYELTRFEPSRFIRTVLRRLSSLAAYYGVAGDPETFMRLASLADKLRMTGAGPLPAPSGRRGVLGSYTLQGPCDEFGPVLELGGLLHVGKGAAFGLGAFQISPLS